MIAARLLAAVMAMALAGCTFGKRTPALLINETGATLSVFVSMERLDAPSGHLSKCRLDLTREPLVIGSIPEGYEQKFRAWALVKLESFDAAGCDASFMVPPDKAVLMFWSLAHGDDSKIPFIDRLEIKRADGVSIRLVGPAADAAFVASDGRRVRSFVVK